MRTTCLVLAAAASGAFAADTYIGSDAGAGPLDARPSSDSAQSDFFTDAVNVGDGVLRTLDFESLATGQSDFSTDVGGVMTTFSTSGDFDYASTGVQNAAQSAILGYDTTSGSGNYYAVWPNFDAGTVSIEIDFVPSVIGWGAYFTGLEPDINGMLKIVFEDGSSTEIDVPENDGGGVTYVGFIGDMAIDKIILEETGVVGSTRDLFGFDDMTLVVVPLPSAGLMGLAGVGLVAGVRRRKA